MRDTDALDLDEMYAGRELPVDLEDRVVRSLMQGGWIEPRRRPWVKWPIRAAAGFVFFAAGWGLGVRRDAPPPDAASRFMLLLWEGPDFAEGTPAGSFADEYAAWAADVARRGVSLSGSELGSERAMIAPDGGNARSLSDATLGGYFILEASSVEAVRQATEGHPHLRYGGWIEVAPIVSR